MNDQIPTSDAAQTLRELALSLEESQRIAGIGSYALDLKTMIWSSSDVLDEIFGIGPDYLRTLDGWLNIVHPDDREMMSSHFSGVAQRRSNFDKEYRIVRASDRGQRWVHGLGRLEVDASGVPKIMRGTIQDITERKRVESDLRQNEELLDLFIQHAPAALAMFDRDMRYIAASRRWIDSFGLKGREIIGRSHYEIFPEIPPRWVTAHRRALGGETLKNEEDRFDREEGPGSKSHRRRDNGSANDDGVTRPHRQNHRCPDARRAAGRRLARCARTALQVRRERQRRSRCPR